MRPCGRTPGMMPQISNYPAYVAVDSRVPAADFLEALLVVIEAVGKRGDAREEILVAARNGFESSGAEALDIVPYLDGVDVVAKRRRFRRFILHPNAQRTRGNHDVRG